VTSPMAQARMAGAIAWITTTSGFAAIVVGNIVVPGDPAATAHNLVAHESLYRLAVAGDLVALLYIAYTLLLYNLFRPVSRDVALLATFFSLVGTAVGAVNAVIELAPLGVLAGSSGGFSESELQSLALMLLVAHGQAADVSLVLFGTYNILIGYLIVRSALLPRVLGALLAFSGVCYLVNSFAGVVAPMFQAHLVPYILVPGLAELLVAGWLLVAGVATPGTGTAPLAEGTARG
jgi:hypothetical protein